MSLGSIFYLILKLLHFFTISHQERPTPRNNPRNVPAHDDGRGAGRAVHQVEDGRPAQPGLGRDQEERGHDR